jgi:hypothetical protein
MTSNETQPGQAPQVTITCAQNSSDVGTGLLTMFLLYTGSDNIEKRVIRMSVTQDGGKAMLASTAPTGFSTPTGTIATKQFQVTMQASCNIAGNYTCFSTYLPDNAGQKMETSFINYTVNGEYYFLTLFLV